MLGSCPGTTVPVQLFRGPQVRVVPAARVVPAEALPVVHGRAGQRGPRHAGRPAAHRLRVSAEALRRQLRVLRLAAQLLLPPVLVRLPRHRRLLRITRVPQPTFSTQFLPR